ncbi:MAG: hydrogenase maturation protease [Candidatus Bathyarchaeia archaeon]
MDSLVLLEKELKKWFSDAERVVVAGVGNPIRMDDYVGVKIVQNLRGKVSSKVLLVECETVPENALQQILEFNPTHVLLIDAAVLGLKPGTAKLVNSEELTNFPAFTSHMLPLRIFCEFIAKNCGAKVALLLIEPNKTDFGEGLTAELEFSAEKVTETLSGLLVGL